MRIIHSHYMTQNRNLFSDTVPESGPGYDIKTLQRMALYDMKREVDVTKITINNERGETGSVFLLNEEVDAAVARLTGMPGVVTIILSVDDN